MIVSRRAASAGAIITGGILLIIEASKWALGKLLDRFAALVMSWDILPSDASSFPWLAMAGALSIILGISLYGIDRRPDKPSPGSAGTNEAGNLLADAMVLDGYLDEPPKYRARFSRNGSGLRFYVEYSSAGNGGLGQSFWSAPRKVLIHEHGSFARGESVSFPLGYSLLAHHNRRWRFGLPSTSPAESLPDILNPSD